jgi:hypothetical protein
MKAENERRYCPGESQPPSWVLTRREDGAEVEGGYERRADIACEGLGGEARNPW